MSLNWNKVIYTPTYNQYFNEWGVEKNNLNDVSTVHLTYSQIGMKPYSAQFSKSNFTNSNLYFQVMMEGRLNCGI